MSYRCIPSACILLSFHCLSDCLDVLLVESRALYADYRYTTLLYRMNHMSEKDRFSAATIASTKHMSATTIPKNNLTCISQEHETVVISSDHVALSAEKIAQR